jgi:hypothetical protein
MNQPPVPGIGPRCTIGGTTCPCTGPTCPWNGSNPISPTKACCN